MTLMDICIVGSDDDVFLPVCDRRVTCARWAVYVCVCERESYVWCTLLHTVSLACSAFLAFWPSHTHTHTHTPKIRRPGRLVVLTFDPSRVQAGFHSDFCYEHSSVCVCVCVCVGGGILSLVDRISHRLCLDSIRDI